MTNTKLGASSVVRPDQLTDTISRLTNRLISDRFTFYHDRADLFNEGFCAALEYVSENPKERSIVALLYKRIFGALSDYINKNSSVVKITKNKETKNCYYKNSEISEQLSSDGERRVKNAKQNIELNEDILNNLIDLNKNPEEVCLMNETSDEAKELLDGVLDFASENLNSRDHKIFEMRYLENKKLREVSKELNISTQRINKLEKNISNSLSLKFGGRFQEMMCNN